jgi:UDP-N-acetylglucosamine acyltransferase
MTSYIHQTAIVSSDAQIGDGVVIGPYCVIGPKVMIGNNVEIKSHVVIEGTSIIGSNNKIFPFACIGSAPQDLKFKGEISQVIIGNNNVIREYVTINPGTQGGGMITSIGSNCLLMVGVHVAHDCAIGDGVIMANNATLAGHVNVGDFAVIGGLSAIHQFVRIGKHAMIGGMAAIDNDIIPYGVAMNERASLEGVNLIGLKRRGFSKEEIMGIKDAYNKLFFTNDAAQTFAIRVQNIAQEYGNNIAVMEMVHFLQAHSERAICKPKTSL